MDIQNKNIDYKVYKLTRFEAFKELDRLSKEFHSLHSIVDKDENIKRREELINQLSI